MIRRIVLKAWRAAAVLALLLSSDASAEKFYDDDPIRRTPPPMDVGEIRGRKLNDVYDLFENTFRKPGERQSEKHNVKAVEFIPAQRVNTLGEVPDDPAWFINRIGSGRMTTQEIVRGPGNDRPPSPEGKWTIVGAKQSGMTPGFRIRDAKGRLYLLKFDPKRQPEMATASDVMGAKFFHALGYNVPENYIVVFHVDQLKLGEQVKLWDAQSLKERQMTQRDLIIMADQVARLPDGRIRATASRFVEGKPVGEFRYYGTRVDDYNDIVPHEHRRDLRGLFVFCAWLNHNDSRAINNMDALVEEKRMRYVKHYLIDFGAMFGSASVVSNTARDGNAYFWEFGTAFKQVVTVGIYTPRWMRDRYVRRPALGMVEYPSFEPEEWKPNYPNAAFQNRLPDDEFWAAKKVMAFSDHDIHSVVREAQYSDKYDEDLLTQYLINRRDAIGRTYFAKVLPLDDFRVRNGRLEFEDLGVKYGFIDGRNSTVQWAEFDNERETDNPIEGASSLELPARARSGAEGKYYSAKIVAGEEAKSVKVYIRKLNDGFEVVGVERTW